MKTPASTSAPVSYRIEVNDIHAHLFNVTLTIAQPLAVQRVSLPVWIPGSYLVREFAKNLQHLKAQQGRTLLNATQLDKCTLQIACNPSKPLVLRYQIYAHDNSVRTAWLDSKRGFFNSTSVCLKVESQEKSLHLLEVTEPAKTKGWSVATGLNVQKINKQGFGTYSAANYDELVDCPVELGEFWSGTFTACGVPHRFVVAGALRGFDGAKLLADTQKICEEEIRFWHGNKKPPFANYLFMLNAVDDGYGGLEHRNSTALICNRKDLPRLNELKVSEGYTTLRGLISHEYFHTWNVKRLRPAEFETYDYTQENYTELLWFFEGFTSYYDDLLLRRSSLLDNPGYFKLLNKTINQVMQTPGRQVQSVAEASFDAWVKYYRQDENTPNTTVSYYTKGALVALCFDLTLRREGHTTLDEVMRALWLRCKAGPMREADFADVLQALGKRSFDSELKSWVHGKTELPLRTLLEQHGVTVHDDPAQLAQRLGLRVNETQGVVVKTVLSGGAAEKAGFAAGDEWLGIEALKQPDGWRMQRLDDLLLYAGTAKKVIALVARDKRLIRLELTIPPPATTWRLAVKDAAKVDAWLAK
ncbi:MAG: M61 family metallopeptidase [Vitreoscilla sp.]|nr:M61 family metallopeptidase [Polaromonas sp.]